MENSSNFLVVDDDAIARSAIGLMITRAYPAAQTTLCGSLAEGIESLKLFQWDVILVDLCLGKTSGLALIHSCIERDITTPVLVMSARQDEEAALLAFKAGAKGYICKDHAMTLLGDALRRLMEGQKYMSSSLADRLLRDLMNDKRATLSPQESAVLIHIGSGRSVKESASIMGLSEKTVRTYRIRLLEKLQLNSDTAIVRYAFENGLIE